MTEKEWNNLIAHSLPSLRAMADDFGIDWIAPAEYMDAEEKFSQLADLISSLPEDSIIDDYEAFWHLNDLLDDAPFDV